MCAFNGSDGEPGYIEDIGNSFGSDGGADLRDESDRQGIRVVIEIKREHHPEIVLNQLFRYTSLQTSFPHICPRFD